MPTVVFILGSGHSGSTLLGMILGTNKDATCLGEFKHIDSVLIKDKLKKVQKSGYCSTCGNHCRVWDTFPREGNPFVNADRVFGSEFLVDTSKYLNWFNRCMEDMPFPYKIVRLARDPKDRFGSFRRRRGKLSDEEIYCWVKREAEMTKFLEDKEHIICKYEDFANKRGIDKVCEFIGMKYDPSMYNYWEKLHHNMRGNVRTATLIQLKHGLLKPKDMSKTQKIFFDDVGFNVKHIDKSKYLTGSDLRMLKKYGVSKIEAQLGY